jgi:hypothetical protein
MKEKINFHQAMLYQLSSLFTGAFEEWLGKNKFSTVGGGGDWGGGGS